MDYYLKQDVTEKGPGAHLTQLQGTDAEEVTQLQTPIGLPGL